MIHSCQGLGGQDSSNSSGVMQLVGCFGLVGHSNCLVCHSDRREESKMLARCTVPVPRKTRLMKEFRFLATLGMTHQADGMTY